MKRSDSKTSEWNPDNVKKDILAKYIFYFSRIASSSFPSGGSSLHWSSVSASQEAAKRSKILDFKFKSPPTKKIAFLPLLKGDSYDIMEFISKSNFKLFWLKNIWFVFVALVILIKAPLVKSAAVFRAFYFPSQWLCHSKQAVKTHLSFFQRTFFKQGPNKAFKHEKSSEHLAV